MAGVTIRRAARRGEHFDAHEAFRKSIQFPFLNQLITNISGRFKDGNCIIFSLLSLFDPKNLPEHAVAVTNQPDDNSNGNEDVIVVDASSDCEDDSEVTRSPATTTSKSLQDYGQVAMKNACLRFGIVEMEAALEEWKDYKQFLVDHQRNMQLGDVTNLLCSDETQRHIFPHMSQLAQICCIIPPHTVDYERDFSQLNFVKTSLRNRMNQKTLDAIIRILGKGPSISEYPFQEAVRLWAERKNRRLKAIFFKIKNIQA